MRADNTPHVIAAARRRSEQTRQRAIAALRHMTATGKTVNFDTVSREAKVSRSWLYSQNDLRAEIKRLRERRPATAPATPHRQRASDASLLRRLEAATNHIQRLEEDNRQLRGALARALGERRAHTIRGQTGDRDTPKRSSSKAIRP